MRKKYLWEQLKKSATTLGDVDFSDFLTFPKYIQIETFKGCNARCVMCGINDRSRERNYMDDFLFEKILKEIAIHREQVLRVSPFLGGEPLLDRKIAQRIGMLKNIGVREVYITTNASLMTSEKAREILESGIDQIDISFHSLDKDKYEKIMVGLSFDKTLSNILGLIAMRNSGGYKTRIRIRSIGMDCNELELKRIEEFWATKLDFDKGDIAYAKEVNMSFVSENADSQALQMIGGGGIIKRKSMNIHAMPCGTLW